MSAAGGAVGGTCTGTTPDTLSAGATSLSFSNITIPVGGSCTVTFTVTSATPGVHTNITSGVSSNEALTGSASNTATLTVIGAPVISKTFVPNKFLPGGTTTVSFSITNPNSFAGLTGVAFTDSLPSGLVVASPNGLTSTCGGTATATAGFGRHQPLRWLDRSQRRLHGDRDCHRSRGHLSQLGAGDFHQRRHREHIDCHR